MYTSTAAYWASELGEIAFVVHALITGIDAISSGNLNAQPSDRFPSLQYTTIFSIALTVNVSACVLSPLIYGLYHDRCQMTVADAVVWWRAYVLSPQKRSITALWGFLLAATAGMF